MGQEDVMPPSLQDACPVTKGTQIGIYGWRKRCLYLIVVLLLASVIMNLAFTIWILRVMDFSINGMGRLRIVSQGLRLEGEAEFLQSLYAAKIRSRVDQPLKFESSKNITLNARSQDDKIVSRITVGQSAIDAHTRLFRVQDPEGNLLFQAGERQVIIGAPSLRVTGKGGVTFKGSIQTPLVRADPYQQLRLESPTMTLKVLGPEGVGIESRAGDISATCLKDLKLKSREGTIWFDSERIEMKKLKTVIPTPRGRTYPGIFQLCACPNGRLFVAPPEGHCLADRRTCQ